MRGDTCNVQCIIWSKLTSEISTFIQAHVYRVHARIYNQCSHSPVINPYVMYNSWRELMNALLANPTSIMNPPRIIVVLPDVLLINTFAKGPERGNTDIFNFN